jgi:hypothetical protein
MKKTGLILILCFAFSSYAQDQLKVMYYNLLNFPDTSPQRADTLKTILHYDLPDVLVVNELQTNTGANLILNNSLNQNGVSYFQKAAFINGPDTDNGFFYNANKLSLYSQQQIQTTLRDISEYVLYYNDPNLSATSDTIFFFFYSVHLKASQGYESQRNIEITTLKNYLNTKSNIENVFIGGDFNFYSDTEPALSTILNLFNVNMQDPANAIGDWHINYNFRNYHTQSTRTSNLGDGSTGGLDDRFDFIFTSKDVIDGTKGIKYLANSYKAMGQDGLRFNQSVVNPTNTDVPQNVATALMYMSDHLPVRLTLDVDYTYNQISELNLTHLNLYFDQLQNQFVLNKALQQFNLILYDLNGKELCNIRTEGAQVLLGKNLSKGVYVWKIITNGTYKTGKIAIY